MIDASLKFVWRCDRGHLLSYSETKPHGRCPIPMRDGAACAEPLRRRAWRPPVRGRDGRFRVVRDVNPRREHL